MAPSILHRALSFSNVPVHRCDVSTLKEASAASNRHEGLALLTTIAEETGFCNPSPLLQNHSALDKRIIRKILRLREALDLPCRSSCDALDEVLLDTLEALKVTYPKCSSGISGNLTSSVQQGLVQLRKVLMSVQDCQEEHSQLSNLGFEKQTIIESESLDRTGEHVAVMLDQVIPMAKEMFSFMESSRSTNAVSPLSSDAAAAAAWPEDLPKRSLPPVLCHTKSAGHHPSDSAEVATSCQDSAMRHTEQLKVQDPVPWQEAAGGDCTGEDAQTSRRDAPSTPTGDPLLLQTTPSSMSPHPLPAPPPSPMPLLGLPMLVQSWEAMQDDKATMATAPTAQQDTAGVSGSKVNSADSVSMEAGQPSSPSSMNGNGTVPSVPPPPQPQPLPPPAHIDRMHEQEGPSTDKPVEVVVMASASSPSQPPSLEQGGPPGKISRAPPPPPPGNIAAALRAKKAACKLKRSTQMGTLYRNLRDRVEGSCTHGGGKARAGKKPRTPGGPKSDAGQGMADALAEMTKRSAYFRQIEEDAENHAAMILELKDAIGSFQSKDMAELVRFLRHVEQQLVCLTDETQVLARFEGFPSKKLDSLRMAAALYSKLDGAVSKLNGWKLAAPISKHLDRVEGYFNKVKDDVDMIERNKDEETKRFLSHNIHFDFGLLVRIKESMVDLSSNCMELALKESENAKETSAQSSPGSPQAAAAPSRIL